MVVKQATDEPFYPDVVLFPIYSSYCVIVRVRVVLKRTVVGD